MTHSLQRHFPVNPVLRHNSGPMFVLYNSHHLTTPERQLSALPLTVLQNVVAEVSRGSPRCTPHSS